MCIRGNMSVAISSPVNWARLSGVVASGVSATASIQRESTEYPLSFWAFLGVFAFHLILLEYPLPL